MQSISWDDFSKVELRVGRIVSAAVFPEVRKPAYVLQVDFGAEIGPLMSECLVTGFHNENGEVALCVPDQPVPLGTKLL